MKPVPFQWNSVALVWCFRETHCLISLEAHVKSIQGVIESSERVTNQEAIKSAQTKLSLEFCVFTSALCETVLVLFGVVCQYSLLVMASKQQQAFRMCVHPCPRYLTGGDTHILCVACLGEEHARSALESTAMCFPFGRSDPAWRSFVRALRLAFPRALVPLLPRHSKGCSPGVCKGNCWRRQRRAPPYLCLHLTGSVPRLRVGKHMLRFLPPWSRHRHCNYLFLRN